jgi:DNA mismatch repair protein MutS
MLPRLQNLHVEIAEEDGELVFLYRISPGSAEHSYGVYAAKLAGLPKPVVRRAEELLREYEAPTRARSHVTEDVAERTHATPAATDRNSQIVKALLDLDLNALSPVEAMMKLYEVRRLAEEGVGEPSNVRVMKTA